MSKIAIAPNAFGSGTFTLAAPNSDTDRTLTLPDASGEVPIIETGTFTPYFTSSGATQSYLSDILTAYTDTGTGRRYGVYTKIGNVVMMQLRVRGNSGSYQNGGASGQTLAIAGLPYRVLKVPPDGTTGDAMYSGLSVGFVSGLTGYDTSGTGFKQYAYIDPDIGSNPNGAILLRYPSTNGTAAILTNFFTGNTDFIIGGIYFTDGTKVE